MPASTRMAIDHIINVIRSPSPDPPPPMKTYPRYFLLCLMTFIVASSVGLNFVLSRWDPATASWATAKPVIGGLIIFAALILNFIGYSRLIGKGIAGN